MHWHKRFDDDVRRGRERRRGKCELYWDIYTFLDFAIILTTHIFFPFLLCALSPFAFYFKKMTQKKALHSYAFVTVNINTLAVSRVSCSRLVAFTISSARLKQFPVFVFFFSVSLSLAFPSPTLIYFEQFLVFFCMFSLSSPLLLFVKLIYNLKVNYPQRSEYMYSFTAWNTLLPRLWVTDMWKVPLCTSNQFFIHAMRKAFPAFVFKAIVDGKILKPPNELGRTQSTEAVVKMKLNSIEIYPLTSCATNMWKWAGASAKEIKCLLLFTLWLKTLLRFAMNAVFKSICTIVRTDTAMCVCVRMWMNYN